MNAGSPRPRRGLSWLLLAYPALVIAGAVTHAQVFPLAAMSLLLTILLWPALRTRRPLPWLLWSVLVAGVCVFALRGWATLLQDLVPVAINLLLAWLFGRTLRPGRQPLVCQLIVVLEGAPRLAQPGIARYARGLTAFWTGLLLLQAGTIVLLLACAVPHGWLAMLGHAPPLAIPARWAQGYVHAGAYVVLVAVFVLEYGFRRWRLRHLEHQRLAHLLRQTALRWPQLMRSQGRADVTTTSFQAPLCVAADHPSLPGHFPGRPLVPGVVLLDEVARALRIWRGERLARVIEAKFVAPLLPCQAAQLSLQDRAGRVAFEIRRDGVLLARGLVEGRGVSKVEHWQSRPEGGGRFALWLIRNIALYGGRNLGRLCLYPITLYFYLRRRPERLASRQYLQRVLPGRVGAWQVMKHIHCFAATIMDRIFLLAHGEKHFQIETEGLDLLDERLARGRGVLLFGSHQGSFEALRAIGARRPEMPLRVLLDKGKTPAMTELLEALAPEVGSCVIDASQDGTTITLAIAEACQQGALVALLADRGRDREALHYAEFLGQPAPFPVGPWLLAHTLKVPVVLCFGLYLGGNRYRLVFEPLADRVDIPRNDRVPALDALIAGYARRLEHYVYVAPYNWFNFYDFWQQDLRAPARPGPDLLGERLGA